MRVYNDKLPMEEISVDVSDQSPTPRGFRYSLDISCVGTTFGWTFAMKRKSDSEAFLRSFIERSDRSIHELKTIRFLTSDHGGEFTSTSFENYLSEKGIVHQTGPANTPNYNPQERHNRTLNQKQRALLLDANLGPKYWIFARECAQHLKNVTPIKRSSGAITPFEMLHGRKPDLRVIRAFGCVCYAHINSNMRDKYADTSVRGIFVGYSVEKRGYRVLLPGDKLIISRSVTFHEGGHVHGVHIRKQDAQS
jgi:hypothetical protein